METGHENGAEKPLPPMACQAKSTTDTSLLSARDHRFIQHPTKSVDTITLEPASPPIMPPKLSPITEKGQTPKHCNDSSLVPPTLSPRPDYWDLKRRKPHFHELPLFSSRGSLDPDAVLIPTESSASTQENNKTYDEVLPFACKNCDACYCSNQSLEAHVQRKHSKQPLRCPHCPQHFPVKSTLMTHMRRKHGHTRDKTHERPIPCPEGMAVLKSKKYFKSHMMIHTGEKPFRCEACGKRFIQKCNLGEHLLSHIQEKRYKCNACGIRFTLKHSLKSTWSVILEILIGSIHAQYVVLRLLKLAI